MVKFYIAKIHSGFIELADVPTLWRAKVEAVLSAA